MHAAAGPAWAVWLEATAVGIAMRQWLWLYPAVEIVHIVGFVVLALGVVALDVVSELTKMLVQPTQKAQA